MEILMNLPLLPFITKPLQSPILITQSASISLDPGLFFLRSDSFTKVHTYVLKQLMNFVDTL